MTSTLPASTTTSQSHDQYSQYQPSNPTNLSDPNNSTILSYPRHSYFNSTHSMHQQFSPNLQTNSQSIPSLNNTNPIAIEKVSTEQIKVHLKKEENVLH